MGPSPLDWPTIKSWSDLFEIELDPQELYALRRLSAAYVDQSQKSKDKSCPPPWVDPDQLDRQKIADKVSSQFDAIIKRRKDKSGRLSKPNNRR